MTDYSHIDLEDWFYGIGQSNLPDLSHRWKLNEDSGDAIDSEGSVDLSEVGTVPGDGNARGPFTTDNYFQYVGSDLDDAFNWSGDNQFILSVKLDYTGTNDTVLQKGVSGFLRTITRDIGGGVFKNTVGYQIGSWYIKGTSDINDDVTHDVQIASIGNNTRLLVDGVTEESLPNDAGAQSGNLLLGVGSGPSNALTSGMVKELIVVNYHTIDRWNIMELVLQELRNL